LKLITGTLGPEFAAMDTQTGKLATGTSIVLTGPNDPAVTLGRGNYIADQGVAGGPWHTVQWRARASDEDLVTGRLVLDDAGHGGTGGDLHVGVEPGSSGSDAPGIERLRITVERDSRMSEVTTTGDALREVLVQGTPGGGGLQVLGDDHAPGWRPGPDAVHEFGFRDVRVIDMSAMTAAVSFDLLISAGAADKFGSAFAGDEREPPSAKYLGGTGDDQIAVLIAPSIAAHRHLNVSFSIGISGGGGDDDISVQVGNLPGAEGPVDGPDDPYNLAPVGIDAGAGNDRVLTSSLAWMSIDLGPGDDHLELLAPAGLVSDNYSLRTITPGPGDDVLVLGPSPHPPQTLVFEAGWGHDVVHGFDVATDLLALGHVGPPRYAAGLRVWGTEPSPGSLSASQPGIDGGPEGLATDSAEEIAALFRPVGDFFNTLYHLYIAVDALNVGKVYQIVDSYQVPGSVSAALLGSIDLGDTPWEMLTVANFLG
jgi:hypothetical protein